MWLTAHLAELGWREQALPSNVLDAMSLTSRAPADSDREDLAHLMWHSYRHTVDDAGETLDDARREVETLYQGGFGPFELQSSLVAVSSRSAPSAPIASATLLTRDRTGHAPGEPFLAFSMTHPTWKRRGLARMGLIEAMRTLRAQGERRLHLVVTRANFPAVSLYESLGFSAQP